MRLGQRFFALCTCLLMLLSTMGCLTEEERTEDVSIDVKPFTMGSIRTDFDDPVYEPVVSSDYTLPLKEGDIQFLESVVNRLQLSPAQMSFLLENGMIGIRNPPQDLTRFYDAYDQIYRHWDVPMFYTSDSVLDAFHHMFEGTLVELESTTLYDALYTFTERMMVLSQMQYNALSEEHRQLAADNVVYFGVALRLLDPDATVKWYAEEDIARTVVFIENATGTVVPPGFHQAEDLTQYEPRSHYTASEKLERYFRAMTWYGRVTFQGKHDDETRRAVLVSLALRDDFVANHSYSRVASTVTFLVGWPDDLDYVEYSRASDQVFGRMVNDYSPLFDDAKLDRLQDVLGDLCPPMISSDLALPGDMVWGLRLLGQACVLDSYVFQRCTSEDVPYRFVPSALDVMAALGSDEAWEREEFDRYHRSFQDNLGELREDIAGYGETDWSSSVYNGWLHTIQALDQDTSPEGFPEFMRTDAWDAKQLNAQMGSWTQLVHDTQLYRKQTYTYQGISAPNAIYVEPVPELYSRLGRMVDAMLDGLEALDIMTRNVEANLGNLSRVLTTFEAHAIAQLEEREVEFDQDVMVSLRWAYKQMKWMTSSGGTCEGRTVLVADVHTLHDATGSLEFLEEGVGYVKLIVVAYPTKDGPVACVGPVFEHYEFSRLAFKGRLTDEEWERMLQDGTAPDPAPWARDFMP